MSASFSFRKKLSEDDCSAIAHALKEHKLELSSEVFERLCDAVGQALVWYFYNRDGKPSSKAETLVEIKRLQKGLANLSETARYVLEASAQHTLTQKRFDASGETWNLWNALNAQWSTGKGIDFELTGEHDNVPMPSLCQFAVLMLKESCEVALSGKFPESKRGDELDIVSACVAPGGRPRDYTKHELVKDIASAFTSATKHKASDTPHGPFDDFLTACLKILNPDQVSTTNRKLIRAALYK